MAPSLSFRRLRLAATIAATLLLTVGALALGATAATAQVRQVKLTEQLIEQYIAAQKPMSAVTEKMQGSTSDKPDPKIQAQLEAISKKIGFKDFAEYGDVAATISMVMAGIDPDTKQFTEQQAAIKGEIAEVEADKSMSADEKAEVLKELDQALKGATPLQYPENVPLVIKYYDKIDAALPQ
jgi:hypothetical protein